MPSIRLVPVEEAHLAFLPEILRDPDVRRFTPIPVPTPPGWEREWYRGFVAQREAGTSTGFAILGEVGPTVLGLVLADHVDGATRTAELSYLVAPAARGRGIATAAVTSLTAHAFGELGMLRLELKINVPNEASKRVAAKCGYQLEGVLRSDHFRGDERVDTELWSRLSTDS